MCIYIYIYIYTHTHAHIHTYSIYHTRGPGRDEKEGRVGFRLTDRVMKDEGLMCEALMAPAPAAKARFDKVAEAMGWSKKTTETVMQDILGKIVMGIAASPEASLDFPGIGVLSVKDKSVSLEPAITERPPGASLMKPRPPKGGLTAASAMFGASAKDLLSKSQSNAMLNTMILPTLEGSPPGKGGIGPNDILMQLPDSSPLKAREKFSPERDGSKMSHSASTPILDKKTFAMPMTLKAGSRRGNMLLSSTGRLEDTSSPDRLTRALPLNDQVLYHSIVHVCVYMCIYICVYIYIYIYIYISLSLSIYIYI